MKEFIMNITSPLALAICVILLSGCGSLTESSQYALTANQARSLVGDLTVSYETIAEVVEDMEYEADDIVRLAVLDMQLKAIIQTVEKVGGGEVITPAEFFTLFARASSFYNEARLIIEPHVVKMSPENQFTIYTYDTQAKDLYRKVTWLKEHAHEVNATDMTEMLTLVVDIAKVVVPLIV